MEEKIDLITKQLKALTEQADGNADKLEALTEQAAGNADRLDTLTDHVAGNTEQLNQMHTKIDKISVTQERHESTLDLLSRRSIDQEAALKHIK